MRLARVFLLLVRPSRTGAATLVLPVVAFAVVTALTLVVLGGAATFFVPTTGASGETDGLYQLFAALATALLLVPLATLGGAGARLSARRREQRLAALRLLGGTAALVRAVTTVESALVAGVGALLGVALHLPLVPLVGLLRFRGAPTGAGALWLGAGPVAAVVAAVVALATVSGVLSLRRVVVSPLGVAARTTPPPQRWVRLALALAVVAGWVVLWNLAPRSGLVGIVLATVAVAGVGAVMAVLNLAGPFLLAVAARRSARRAGTPERLLAARFVLDDPRAAWRGVSGVAMVTFVAVVAGVGLAVVGAAGSGGGLSATDALLVTDLRTGVLVTLALSFVVVAVSAALNAASAVLDRAGLWVALDRAGTPRAVMEAARTRTVTGPLRVVVVGAAVVGAAAVLPLTGAALLLRPTSVLVLVGCVALGVALVVLALRATRPVMSAVLAAPERA